MAQVRCGRRLPVRLGHRSALDTAVMDARGVWRLRLSLFRVSPHQPLAPAAAAPAAAAAAAPSPVAAASADETTSPAKLAADARVRAALADSKVEVARLTKVGDASRSPHNNQNT